MEKWRNMTYKKHKEKETENPIKWGKWNFLMSY